MSVIKITTEKPIQEFNINGEMFQVKYDDEALETYEKKALEFHAVTQKKLKKNADKQEVKQYENTMKSAIKDVMDTFFGEGSYDKIYESTGKSHLAMVTVVEGLHDWLKEKTTVKSKKITDYYTK